MVRDFKFFHGQSKNTFAVWTPETDGREYYDVERHLTNTLSEQIAREIDDNIVEELTRRINGGEPQPFQGEIRRFSDNIEYFNRWMDIGGQRA